MWHLSWNLNDGKYWAIQGYRRKRSQKEEIASLRSPSMECLGRTMEQSRPMWRVCSEGEGISIWSEVWRSRWSSDPSRARGPWYEGEWVVFAEFTNLNSEIFPLFFWHPLSSYSKWWPVFTFPEDWLGPHWFRTIVSPLSLPLSNFTSLCLGYESGLFVGLNREKVQNLRIKSENDFPWN